MVSSCRFETFFFSFLFPQSIHASQMKISRLCDLFLYTFFGFEKKNRSKLSKYFLIYWIKKVILFNFFHSKKFYFKIIISQVDERILNSIDCALKNSWLLFNCFFFHFYFLAKCLYLFDEDWRVNRSLKNVKNNSSINRCLSRMKMRKNL